MRYICLHAAAMVALCLTGQAYAQANSVSTVQRPTQSGVAPPPAVAFHLYKVDMLKLRKQALAQRARDGGALTPEHDADIQRRIDHITQLYHRRLQGLIA